MAECGQAPNVTLSCADGSARVDWAPPVPYCRHDCKVRLTCWNGTSWIPYKEV